MSGLGGLAKVYQDIQGLRVALGNKTWSAENADGRAVPAIYETMIAQLKEMEAGLVKEAKQYLKEHPAWMGFGKDVKGLGPTLGAQLIGYIEDIGRFDTVSKLWKYCGLACVDGKADRMRKGQKASYNPKIKSLLYNIGCSFIKTKSPYRRIYDDKKQYYRQVKQDPQIMAVTGDNAGIINNIRQDKKEWPRYLATAIKEAKKQGKQKPWTDNHVHMAALRKMEKIFLAHLWEQWRIAEGLPTRREYVFDCLGHTSRYEAKDFKKQAS